MDPFTIYESAKTQADLYRRQGGIHSDFFRFLEEPKRSVDLSDVQIKNPTDAKKEFLQTMFAQTFHTVYGTFGSNPFGPGNNILFQFDRAGNRLRLVRLTEKEAQHPLTDNVEMFTEVVDPMSNLQVRGAQFKTDDLEISFIETPSTYKRVVNGDPQSEPAKVYNLQARKNGKTVYNYFMVPIEFSPSA